MNRTEIYYLRIIIKHRFSVLIVYVLRMGLPRCMGIKQLKSLYYAPLNVQQNDQTTNKNI